MSPVLQCPGSIWQPFKPCFPPPPAFRPGVVPTPLWVWAHVTLSNPCLLQVGVVLLNGEAENLEGRRTGAPAVILGQGRRACLSGIIDHLSQRKWPGELHLWRMKDEAFRQMVLPDRASVLSTRKLLEPGLTAQMGSHAVHRGAIFIRCSLSLSQELLALYT